MNLIHFGRQKKVQALMMMRGGESVLMNSTLTLNKEQTMNVPTRSNNLQRTTNRNPIWSLQNEMNTLFDQFFGGETPLSNVGGRNWPSIEVKEEEGLYQVVAEIPGVDEKDLKLELSNNVLEISGERKNEYKEDNDRGYFSEISYGKFYRSIPFDQEVNDEKVSAKMKDGVLRITVEKTAKGKTKNRKIQITH